LSQDQKPPGDASAPPIFPESTLAPEGQPPPSRFTRGAARSATPAWHDTTTPLGAADAAAPRPLLDLFPPPFGHDRAQGPATAGAPPPRIVRNRLSLKPEAAGQPPIDEQPMSDSVSYDESVAAAVADLERQPESSDERSVGDSTSPIVLVGRVILLLALMLAGAAAAAWVFRAQVSQLLNP
jgi:hypothetical protein